MFSKQTLSDCLLFDSESNKNPIADILDLTRTDGGYRKLIEILSTKKESLEELIQAQDLLKYILNNLSECDLGLRNADTNFMMDHCKSSYDLSSPRQNRLLFKLRNFISASPELITRSTGAKGRIYY